ncbi:uncharacterized protein LOC134216567 [Armigeres subalbatus]|uniref:uncharacterized protein LOC134216567 n=1 Tax=Armigeres subalbatus TaxID=124917 RepID=UPI002ECFD568
MTSKIPISIKKNKNKKLNSENGKNIESSKSTKSAKSGPRIWSYFSKRQPEATAVLDEQLKKNSHLPGQIPAYLRKKSHSFFEQDSSAPSSTIPTTDVKHLDTKVISQKPDRPNVGTQSMENRSFFQTFSEAHQNDLKDCAESRKELEVQIDQLRMMSQKESAGIDEMQSFSILPFLTVFLQCLSLEGSGGTSKRDLNRDQEVEEMDDVLSTIEHLDSTSAHNREKIRTLRARNEQYRTQVEIIEIYVQKYREQNKLLKRRLANLVNTKSTNV